MRRCLRCGSVHTARDWACPECGCGPETADGIPLFAPELAFGRSDDANYRYAGLRAAEDSHFWFRGRAALIVWALHRYCPEMRSMLEIGCGTGQVAEAIRRAFPAVTIVASEVLVAGLQYAAQRVTADFVQLDARHIPFDREFDVIGAFDVLEHIDEDEDVLKQLCQALRSGGRLVITVPQHPWLWSALDTFSHHRRRYRRRELVTKLERAGFEVIRTTSFVSVLLPVLLALRSLRPAARTLRDPLAEFRIHSLLNRVGGLTLLVERAAIRAGVSLPVGGSILAVARRGMP
jgi:SAM-dependent methyltransferase